MTIRLANWFRTLSFVVDNVNFPFLQGIGSYERKSRAMLCVFGSTDNDYDIIPGDVRSITCGSQFTIVLFKDGKFKMCGTLNGSVYPRLTTLEIQFPLKCINIACGRKHALALLEGHFVLSWGVGYFGQLGLNLLGHFMKINFVSGHGDDISWDTPKMVHALEPRLLGSRVTSVYCGGSHSAALTDTGKVFTWGLNKYGQCMNYFHRLHICMHFNISLHRRSICEM